MRKWEESEDNFLRSCYVGNTVQELSNWLNRTEDAIETRIKFLKLDKSGPRRKPNTRRWTFKEIVILKSKMLVDNKTVAKELNRSTTSVRKMKSRLRSGLTFPVKDNLYEYINGIGLRDYRKIMEDVLGRKLKSFEHVHHIDCNKKNNHPSNLYLCASPEIHGSTHAQLDNLLYRMLHTFMESGVIEFKDGKYYYGRNFDLIHLMARHQKEVMEREDGRSIFK